MRVRGGLRQTNNQMVQKCHAAKLCKGGKESKVAKCYLTHKICTFISKRTQKQDFMYLTLSDVHHLDTTRLVQIKLYLLPVEKLQLQLG